MDIRSFTPMSTTALKESLKDAHMGMWNHCVQSTINDIIIPRFDKYVNGRIWFSKKKTLNEWLLQKQNWYGYMMPRFQAIANGNDYRGFIDSTISNCNYSSTGTIYMSDEAMSDYKHIIHCISNEDKLNDIKKSREGNKVLWDFYEANWRVKK